MPRKKLPDGYKYSELMEIAALWDVSDITVRNWVEKGFNPRESQLLARRFTQNPNTRRRLRKRAFEILHGKTPESVSADLEEAEERVTKGAIGIVEDFERELARYQAKQRQAEALGNTDQEENAINQRVKLGQALTRIQMLLKRMGQESGQNIGRKDVEKIIAAFASRACIGIHNVIEKAAKTVSGAGIEEAVYKLEPIALYELFLQPFIRARDAAAGCGLPAWVVDSMRTELGNHVENGESYLDSSEAA